MDDCLDHDGTTLHLNAETDGYLAVFPRHDTPVSTPSRRCPWVLSVNSGRRINITWRVSPSPVRYIPPGVAALPLDGRNTPHGDEAACSLKLTFIEVGHEQVQWTCRRQDTVPIDRSAQVEL